MATSTNRIDIFRPGRHQSAGGATIEFSDADLRAAAAAYDPEVHEAPIVVGHPKTDAPAYGWVQSLAFAEGTLRADTHQVDAAFAELVNAGRFKRVSASFYTPDSAANPKPGAYYLRHVGFLGAQPPAVKGLKAASFAEGEGGVVEFADIFSSQSTAAGLFRRLREWLIGSAGVEAADRVLPEWDIKWIEDNSRPAPAPAPAFDAATDKDKTWPINYGEGDMPTPEQLRAQQEALDARKAALDARDAAAAAKEAQFAERDRAARRVEHAAYIDKLIGQGRLLPKDKGTLVEFMELVGDGKVSVEFAEDGKPKGEPKPALQVLRDFLAAQPKVVDYRERAAPDKHEQLDGADANAIAKAALDFQEVEAKAGRTVRIEAAVEHVMSTTKER